MQSSFQSKLEHIRTGATKKTDLGVKQNKGVIQGKGAKFIIEEKEKKFEEAGVKRKKRNYVLYESKLGTEKEQNLKKIEEPKPMPKFKPKPKPVPVARPRMEERIVLKKKRLEYLDNYQYLETKVIRRPNPNRVSIVTHQRLGDIIGGFYEEKTYQKQIIRNTANAPSTYSSQTTRTTSRGGPQGQTQKKTVTTSRTIPAQPREYRSQVVQKNVKNTIPLRGNRTTTTTTKTVTTTQRSSSRPKSSRGNNSGSTTTTTTTRKVVTRSQSAGRKH